MKKIILTLVIILTLALTSCASTDKAGIEVFIDRYNSVSELSIQKENLTVTVYDNHTVHNAFLNGKTIITLVTDESCEINECYISTSNKSMDNSFKDVCTHSLISITGCDETTANTTIAKAFKSQTTIGGYEINVNKDALQTTLMIRLLTENQSINPTLKEFLK